MGVFSGAGGGDGGVPPADVPPADVPPADVPPAGVPPADVPPVDAENLERIRIMIQRQLFLIIHAFHCQEGNNDCPLHHCPMMKDVLQHMQGCQDGRACLVPHCASSRRMIIHYHGCPGCLVCPPKREPPQRDQ